MTDLDDTEQDTRQWRIGSHYGIHLYAVNPDGDDQPIATALTPEVAAQIVAEHALCTTPYADDEHRGGSWVQMLSHMMGQQMQLQRELDKTRAERDQAVSRYERARGIVDGRMTWRKQTACPGETTVVHDRDGAVWRRQPNHMWLADHSDATPGAWSDLVRVYGPITEGLPPAKPAAS